MRTALPLPLKPIALGLAAGTLIAAAGAVRAEEQAQSGKAPAFRSVDADRGSAQPQPVDLARLYADGMSARELIDAPVRGENGERIGDVKDIVVNEHGNIARLIVEVGGFFELADQHIAVPWEDLAFGEDMQFVQVPLKEVESGTYALGGRVPQVRNPVFFSRNTLDFSTPPPILGEHTRAVLAAELGLSDGEILSLNADGAIG